MTRDEHPGDGAALAQRRLLRRLARTGDIVRDLADICHDLRAIFEADGAFVALNDPRAPDGVQFAFAGLDKTAAASMRGSYIASAGLEPAAGAIRAPLASRRASHGAVFVFGPRRRAAFGDEVQEFLGEIGALIGRLVEADRMSALPACPLGYEENRRDCIYQAHDLADSELRFRQLAENIREAFFLVDPGMTKVHYVSPAYEEIWGLSRESLYGDIWSFAAAIHPDDRPTMDAMIANARRGEWDTEYRIVRPDGRVRWVHSRGFPIRDAHGGVYRVAGIAEDVTERHDAIERLRANERRYRMLFEENPLPLWVFDMETLRFLDVNEAACGKYGYSRDEFLAMSVADIRPAEEIEEFRSQIHAAGTGERHLGQWRHRLRDGREIIVEVVAHRCTFEGRRVAFVCPIDVTDRLRAEAALRESERRFADMLANARQIAMMLDTEGRITYCNDYLLECTGWTREAVLGRNWFDTFMPPDLAWRRTVFAQILVDAPDPWHREGEIMTRAGERRTIEWNSSVLRSVTGDVIGTASLGVDITDRRRAEQEVRELNATLERRVADRTAALQAANEELEAFDYSVAHDLRAPLARARGFAEALLNDEGIATSERGRDYAGRIARAAEHMDELVGDLLRLSLVSREKLHREKVDLCAMARTAFDRLHRTEPGRSVELVLPERLEADADPRLLAVVLDNLIGNAWKFTSRRADARIEMGVQNGAWFVADNGAGFDPAHAARLFTPFQRLHKESDFQGTGIGLAIVQRIVHRHGGEAWAEGAAGRGATIRFTLSR